MTTKFALTIAAAATFVGLWFFPTTANATSCDDKPISVERAFMEADVVFAGVVDEASDSPPYMLQVSETYKSPAALENAKRLEVHVAGFGGPKFEAGVEFLVYGDAQRIDDSYRIVVGACGNTKPSPDAAVRHLRVLAENPELFTEKVGTKAVILVGQVASAAHTLVRPKQSGRERDPYVVSNLGIEISEILKNSPNFAVPTNAKSIDVNVRYCGENYKVGHEYLIFARPEWVLDRQSEDKRKRKQAITVDCRAPLDFREKDLLRDLSNAHQPKEGNDGDQYNE